MLFIFPWDGNICILEGVVYRLRYTDLVKRRGGGGHTGTR